MGKRGGASLGTCVQCENGTFQSKKGQASCSTCENGFIPNEAQTACERPWYQIPSDCEPGEFLDDTDVDNKYNWGCVACPLGCDCFNYPSCPTPKHHHHLSLGIGPCHPNTSRLKLNRSPDAPFLPIVWLTKTGQANAPLTIYKTVLSVPFVKPITCEQMGFVNVARSHEWAPWSL